MESEQRMRIYLHIAWLPIMLITSSFTQHNPAKTQATVFNPSSTKNTKITQRRSR